MDIEIRKIKNAGTEDEYLILRATKACDIGNYLVFDELSSASDTASGKLRHLYIFPSQPLSEGDFIWLYTHKQGIYDTHKNTSGTITHKFYWGVGHAIWKTEGDKVYLVHYNEWVVKTIEEEG